MQPKQTSWETGEPTQLLFHFSTFCIYGILEIKHRPCAQCKELLICICFLDVSHHYLEIHKISYFQSKLLMNFNCVAFSTCTRTGEKTLILCPKNLWVPRADSCSDVVQDDFKHI